MRVQVFVLLCVCAFASAAVTLGNDARTENSIEHSLGESQYHLTLQPNDNNIFIEDDVRALDQSSSVQERNVVTDSIRDLLEEFRDIIIHGTDIIPVLDPFVIDRIGPVVFTATGVRIEGNLRNFRVEGLKWFTIDRLTFQPLRLTMGIQITVPWIISSGDYDARATIALLGHSAGGNFRVFINRLVSSVDLRMGTNLSGGHLVLRDLNIQIDVHDTHIQLNGLFGSTILNTILNTFVQSITQEVIQTQLEPVSALLSEQLFDIINEVLSQFTLDDLLGNSRK